jgi:phosphomannomutase
LAAAIASVLGERQARPQALVARDERADGAALAAEVGGVLEAGGCEVANAGALPTPVVTYAVGDQRFDAGVIVTASHNPAGWTGLKVKVPPGCPPDRAFEQEVQRRAEDSSEVSVGSALQVDPFLGAHLTDAYLRRLLGYLEEEDGGRTLGVSVVVDGLNGVGGELLRDLLAGAGCEVATLGALPMGDFGGVSPDPILAEARARAREAVVAGGADVGFVLDGDADRLGVIDERGRYVEPHDLLALLLPLVRRGEDPDAVAVTVAAGSIVRRAAAELGLEVFETPVGFKHVAPLMREGRVFAGGGGVGDIGFRFHGLDRDPLLTALLIARLLGEGRGSLGRQVADLHRRLGETSGATRSLPLPPGSAPQLKSLGGKALAAVGLGGEIVEVSHLDGVKFYLSEDRFLLLRLGTTEPVLRLNLEMGTAEEVEAVLESIRARMEVFTS